jgi:hypothetical protein
VVIALSGWWIFGWGVAAVVVVVAAGLLLAIIGLGRRIARQADETTGVLDAARENTEPLWAVKSINLTLHRIVTGLATARESVTR